VKGRWTATGLAFLPRTVLLEGYQPVKITRMTSQRETGAKGNRDSYRPSWPTRCLLWIGGVDPDLLSSRLEYYRGAAMGTFVIIVALLGGVTFSLYVAVIAGRWEPWMLPFAAFWAVILFCLDRSILVDPHYGDLRRAEREADAMPRASIASPWPPMPATESPNGQQHTAAGPPDTKKGKTAPRLWLSWHLVSRAFIYVSRVAIAIIVAILISEVVVLLIFRPEIMLQAEANQNSAFQAKIAVLATEQQTALGLQIADLQARIKDNNASLSAPYNVMQQARANYLDEVGGHTVVNTPGFGPYAEKDLNTYLKALSAYNTDVQAVANANNGLRGQISSLTEEQAEYGSSSSASHASLQGTSAGKQAYADTHGSIGWLDQEAAFSDYEHTHGGLAVHWIPWLIRILLVLIDLLPLGMKLLSSSSVYGRRVRDQGQLARYGDRRGYPVRRADLDRGADLDDYRAALAALLDYQRRERYRRDRTDHLSRSNGGFDD
jgi:hypothetical protein